MKPDLMSLLHRYASVRKETRALCSPLLIEDFGIQAMPDVSPPKWHLAHTTWFFEEFLLKPFQVGWKPFHPQFGFLFNSYYEQVGEFFPRAQRGLLARPAVAEILRYREQVDRTMENAISWLTVDDAAEFCRRLELGLHHEQQHQELLLTDIKYNFYINPLRPAYLDCSDTADDSVASASSLVWTGYAGGLVEIGHVDGGFAFDNEQPRHPVYLQPFRLACRLTTNAEYLRFIEDDGYLRPEFWLSDGWRTLKEKNWKAPLYWEWGDNTWQNFTLGGMRSLSPSAPVCHVSYYEADAYARWSGCRLPEESEWEAAVCALPVAGNLRESGKLQPCPAPANSGSGIQQGYGDVWEWTRSAYLPYPGYLPVSGALGEYNGKFMCNQSVLRGGSCVTPTSHIRASYRNFFTAADRWQFSGIRLAEDA